MVIEKQAVLSEVIETVIDDVRPRGTRQIGAGHSVFYIAVVGDMTGNRGGRAAKNGHDGPASRFIVSRTPFAAPGNRVVQRELIEFR